MRPVAVRILHVEPDSGAGPLERRLAAERAALAGRHRTAFERAGAEDVRIEHGAPDDTPFGARLRRLAAALTTGPGHGSGGAGAGMVVLGSGAIPLATGRDLGAFVAAARSDGRYALANNRFSADVVAISDASALARLPDLPSDNALPRWLDEVEGFEVDDLRRRWRLGIDLDSPLDALLVDRSGVADGLDDALVRSRLTAIADVAADRRSEVLVAGRTSASTVGWLERRTAARVRALIEERGLRAASRLALGAKTDRAGGSRRPPRSVLGRLLVERGPEDLGRTVAELSDAALIDTRVLLADRLGPDERRWPPAEDRFAADLLLVDRIRDPWLAALARSARDSRIPIILGGHTLVGPGVRLVVRGGGIVRRRASVD